MGSVFPPLPKISLGRSAVQRRPGPSAGGSIQRGEYECNQDGSRRISRNAARRLRNHWHGKLAAVFRKREIRAPAGLPEAGRGRQFFTGVRPSELIALLWTSVDLSREQIRIDRALVRRHHKATKTYKSRDVDLQQPALEALKRQRQLTFRPGGHVFLNPHLGSHSWIRQIPFERCGVRRYPPWASAIGMRARLGIHMPRLVYTLE